MIRLITEARYWVKPSDIRELTIAHASFTHQKTDRKTVGHVALLGVHLFITVRWGQP